ncbi:hypothetical protein Trydic_g9241 [Trypoxylus dichotomus]
MCILFIHTDPNPQPNGYRVIIISNRDEFYARPSQQISRVNDVIGGRDLEPNRSGGMWLGVSVQQTENFKFRFGALLNVTGEEHKHGIKGRGFIVTDYLEGDNIAEKYMSSLINSEEEYNGFNFVAVEVSQNGISTHYCSNISKSYTRYVGKQVLGFGNTVLETPLKKVLAGTENFEMLIEECSGANDKDKLVEKLLYLLKWKKRHLPDSELQRRQPSWYEGLSSLFVNIPNAGYGSRTHSIILIDYNWNMEFFEATMKEPININDPTWLTDAIKARL